jgi:hypothetical protein
VLSGYQFWSSYQFWMGIVTGTWAFHRLVFVLPARRRELAKLLAAPAVLDADWNRIRELELELFSKLMQHGSYPGCPFGAGPPDGWYPAGYDFETGRVPEVVQIAQSYGMGTDTPVVHLCRKPDLPAACGASYFRWKTTQLKDVNCEPCLAAWKRVDSRGRVQPSSQSRGLWQITGHDHQISTASGMPSLDMEAGTEWRHGLAKARLEARLRLAGDELTAMLKRLSEDR